MGGGQAWTFEGCQEPQERLSGTDSHWVEHEPVIGRERP